MHAALVFAFRSHAGADEFGEAVDVVRIDPQTALDFTAHVFAPRLGTEAAGLERQAGKINALFLRGFGKEQGIRGGAGEQGGAEVAHDVQLAAGIAGRNRDHVGTDAAHAVMHTKTAGKHAVTEGILYRIALFATGHGQGAGHDFRPQVDIVLRVGADHRRAGGAGGGVDFDQIFTRTGEKPVRVGFAQFVLGGEGQLGDVFQAADVVGPDALFIKLVTIERHPRINAFDRFLQFFQLCLTSRFQRAALGFLVPDRHVLFPVSILKNARCHGVCHPGR